MSFSWTSLRGAGSAAERDSFSAQSSAVGALPSSVFGCKHIIWCKFTKALWFWNGSLPKTARRSQNIIQNTTKKKRKKKGERTNSQPVLTSFSGQLFKFNFLNQTKQNWWVVSAYLQEMQRPRISLTCWFEAFIFL